MFSRKVNRCTRKINTKMHDSIRVNINFKLFAFFMLDSNLDIKLSYDFRAENFKMVDIEINA